MSPLESPGVRVSPLGVRVSQEDSLVLFSEGRMEQDKGVSVRDFRNCPTLEGGLSWDMWP